METELACLPAVVAADVVVGEMSRLHDDLPRYFAKIYIILLFRRYFLALGVSCVVFRCCCCWPGWSSSGRAGLVWLFCIR